MNANRSSHCIIAACLLTGLLLGCDDRSTGPDAEGGPVAVFSVEPEEATQGETVEVRVRGSGFRPDHGLVWERNGVPDPNIEIASLRLVSPGEFVVELAVGSEAVVASYDLTVVDRWRVRGIATELFHVRHGVGAELTAEFSFDYDGHRTGSFSVDTTFILHPDSMWTNSGEWALTYFLFNYGEQYLGAQMAREDGLVDFIDCYSPGGRVREPGTRPLECWMELGADIVEWTNESVYMTSVAGDRPGDGSGRLTFTQVSPHRLVGEFSITMHQFPDPEGDQETLQITNGSFDLPVLSQYWNDSPGDDGDDGDEDPPPVPLQESWAQAINDHGIVVGTVRNEEGERRGVRWTVGSDGAVTGPEELGIYVSGINNEGTITGNMGDTAFIFDGELRSLAHPAGAFSTWGMDINDEGVVTGYAVLDDGTGPPLHRGYVWLNPHDPERPPLQLPSMAAATVTRGDLINNDGVIAGFSNRQPDRYHRWQLSEDGILSDPEPIGLDYVRAMNDATEFVGKADLFQGVDATLLRGDTHIQLLPLPGDARADAVALNDPLPGQPLQVVGVSRSSEEDISAVVWSVDADGAVTGPTLLDLPNGYTVAIARDVNAHGWIVGEVGGDAQTPRVATLWRPGADGSGYEIIPLGTLGEPGSLASSPSTGMMSCRSWPKRGDRCR